MKTRFKFRALSAVLAAFFTSSAVSARAETLSGNDLKEAISGKRVYLAVPLGGEFPLYYAAGGRVDGSGEAAGLGRLLKPNDSGRWWVNGDKLCQKWQTWYEGKVFCFTVTPKGDSRIAWTRDDGYSGTARIGK